MDKIHKTFIFYSAFLCILLTSVSSYADHSAKKLNAENIEKFVMDMSEKAKKAKGGEDHSGFFNTHLHPAAFFLSEVKYNIPGFPSQQNELSMSKQQYIESASNKQSIVSDFEADVSVSNIKISRNKRNATLVVTTNENAYITVPNGRGSETVPVSGSSSCKQIIRINDDDILQVYSAKCTTDMSFESVY